MKRVSQVVFAKNCSGRKKLNAKYPVTMRSVGIALFSFLKHSMKLSVRESTRTIIASEARLMVLDWLDSQNSTVFFLSKASSVEQFFYQIFVRVFFTTTRFLWTLSFDSLVGCMQCDKILSL